MRPDEHKKKKNAAYKKKHGISKDAGEEAGSKKGGKNKSDKLKSSEEDKHTTKSERDASSLAYRDLAGAARHKETMDSPSNTSSSDSETDVRSKKKPPKTFRRREIVSNWQKYELQPDAEEKATARGESYEKLLNASGEAVSHFRFKDELQWEQEAELSQEDSNDKYSQLLSINPSKLAQSLACLPVHQVLGINENVFSADQVESMMIAAKENQSLYSPNQSQDLLPANVSYVPDSSHDEMADTDPEKKESGKNSLFQTLKYVKPSNEISSSSRENGVADAVNSLNNDEPETQKITQSPNIKQEVDNKNSDTVGSCQKPAVESSLSLQDDDLDFLLNMETPTQTVVQPDKNSPAKGKLVESSLSSVSPKPDVSSSTTASSPSKATKVNAKEHKDAGNLEDWLDSILDD